MMPRLRCVLLTLLACALVVMGAAAFVAARAGHWLEAPGQSPTRADAIAVLGGDDDGERAARAAELYREGIAPRLVLTGLQQGVAAIPAWLNWRADQLEASGVPRSALRFELEARSSYTEAVQLLALMRKERWRTLVVVSDPPHMRRLSWMYADVFAGSGVEYVLVASRPDWWRADGWWRDEKSGQFVIQELIKLGYYTARKWTGNARPSAGVAPAR